MKKGIVGVLILTAFLTGCTNTNKSAFIENTSQDVELLYNSESEDQMVDAIRIDTSADGDNTAVLDVSMAADPKNYANTLHFSEDITPGSFDEKDYSFTVKGETITLGDDFLNFYEKIGTAKIEKSKACLEQGYDIDYYYNDDKLVVYTMVNGSKQLIFNIEIRDDKCVTSKGARVGKSSKDDIYEMYGMPSDYSATVFKYVLSDKQYSLDFLFDANGILEGIDYVDNAVM